MKNADATGPDDAVATEPKSSQQTSGSTGGAIEAEHFTHETKPLSAYKNLVRLHFPKFKDNAWADACRRAVLEIASEVMINGLSTSEQLEIANTVARAVDLDRAQWDIAVSYVDLIMISVMITFDVPLVLVVARLEGPTIVAHFDVGLDYGQTPESITRAVESKFARLPDHLSYPVDGPAVVHWLINCANAIRIREHGKEPDFEEDINLHILHLLEKHGMILRRIRDATDLAKLNTHFASWSRTSRP